jgi:hypothetical protein
MRAELEAALRNVATRDDLRAFATKEDLRAFATKEELRALATKDELRVFATKEDLREMRDELRTHFDVVAESFRAEFRTLHDWVEANVHGLATRIDTVEASHGGRLDALDGRVTRLERRRT